jgi:hypothetical protein
MENKIEIYKGADNQTEIKVQFDEDTVWLSQEQMSLLFKRGRTSATGHIQNIFREGELVEDLVCRKFRHTTQHGAIKGKTQSVSIKQYNLDVANSKPEESELVKKFVISILNRNKS